MAYDGYKKLPLPFEQQSVASDPARTRKRDSLIPQDEFQRELRDQRLWAAAQLSLDAAMAEAQTARDDGPGTEDTKTPPVQS
jgi:hypothetical protein